MSDSALLVLKTYDALTVNAALNTDATYAPNGEKVSYMVVASGASSPTGTTIAIQGSLDGTNFATLTSAISVTGNGTFLVENSAAHCSYIYYRLTYARSSGSYVATTTVCVKGSPL